MLIPNMEKTQKNRIFLFIFYYITNTYQIQGLLRFLTVF